MPENRPAHQQLRTVIAIAAARAVSAVLRVCLRESTRRAAPYVALSVGLVVQMGLVFVTMYLIDLAISLCELWADLARKHLEITL